MIRFTESILTLRVRPNDLDSLGHVNNATVLEYFEAGRWAWMDQHGLRRATTVVPVVSRIEVDYRREILPQEVVVRTELSAPTAEAIADGPSYSADFRQQILLREGQLAAEARVQVAFIDRTARSLRTLQDFLATTMDLHSERG